ncbi:MAG: HigA family addiction module antitoxin [Rhizobiaceae bacterium]
MMLSEIKDYGELDLITPGEILLEDFLAPLGISQKKLAETIDVPPGYINDIANNRRRASANMAFRLSMAFDMTIDFWLNLQNQYDVRKAYRAGLADLKIQPLVAT